jgi:hypothetical protein
VTASLENESEVGESVTLGEVAVPVPESDTVWFETLLATLTEAVRLPLAVGVKVTLIAHEEFAASELPQLFDCAKSDAFVPEIEMPVIESAALPEFETVTD